MTRPQVFRLTADVPNPKHDGRRRYGLEAVKVFKAGSLFKFYPAREGLDPVQTALHEFYEFDERTVPVSIGRLLRESAVRVEPANKAEVLASYDLHANRCAEVIDHMLAAGVLTLAQFDAACAALRAEYDAQ